MTVEVFRAQSEQDREEPFRFRYCAYVEEMGRYRRTADHRGRLLIEPEAAPRRTSSWSSTEHIEIPPVAVDDDGPVAGVV